MSDVQATPSVHVPSRARSQEILLQTLSSVFLPKQTAFRKCSVGHSPLLIFIV